MSNPSTPQPPPAPARPPRTEAPGQSTRKPLQFSMRTMLIVVTIAAVFAALTQVMGVEVLLLLLLIAFFIVTPVCVATLAYYCRGYRRTYYVGALAGSVFWFVLASFLLLALRELDLGSTFIFGVFELIAIVAGGYTAYFTRRFLERRSWHLPSNRDDSTPGA